MPPVNKLYFESIGDDSVDQDDEQQANPSLLCWSKPKKTFLRSPSPPPPSSISPPEAAVNASTRPSMKTASRRASVERYPTRKSSRSDDDDEDEEDDPVLSYFTARQTRVRFAAHETNNTTKSSIRDEPPEARKSLKRFLQGALFLNNNNNNRKVQNEIDQAVAQAGPSRVTTPRTSATAPTPNSLAPQEVVKQVLKLRNKAARAIQIHHRYKYALKCLTKALNLLEGTQHKNASTKRKHDELTRATRNELEQAHAMATAYANSANIVRMGIKAEDLGQYIKALKLYTVAYRIRHDQLSTQHPSLPFLLNLLGSVQIQRREYAEALPILELALQQSADPVTRAVTYREMGRVHEYQQQDAALDMYHGSLQCLATCLEMNWSPPEKPVKQESRSSPSVSRDLSRKEQQQKAHYLNDALTVNGEHVVEVSYETSQQQQSPHESQDSRKAAKQYNAFFVQPPSEIKAAHIEAASTLHRIAQWYRVQHQYVLSARAFE